MLLPASRRRFLLLVFLAAFLIRLGAVLALRDPWSGPGSQLGADGREFNQLALSVAAGHGYAWPDGQPTSFRAPGFPLMLAGVYWIFGESYPAAYVLFCVLGAVSCVLVFLALEQVTSARLARQAALLSVVYFPHIYLATVFASESVFILFLSVGLWALIRFMRRPSWALLAGAGIALGWSALTRSFAIVLLPLLGATLLWWGRRRLGRTLVQVAFFAVIFLGVIAPWTMRNYVTHGRLVAIATNGGSTFYGANNSLVLNEWRHFGGWVSTVDLPGRALIDATPDEVSHDEMEWQLGKQWVRSHVVAMPALCLGKFLRLWAPDIDSGNKKAVALSVVFYTPFLVLFVAAAVYCTRDRRWLRPGWLALHATMLATVLTALVFWGSPRFRDANLVPLMAYAAVGCEWFRNRRKHSHLEVQEPGAASGVSRAGK